METNLANINVVVRCRGRNRQEVESQSSVIVKIPGGGAESNEICINTTNETGIAADMSSKTFTVDKVYGPETDQSQFFEGTAEPMFKEFLKGYNCTMFAYGQTGTGKTYTMHGDERIDENSGSYSPNAGIIPRILYTLFDTLNCLQGADFVIKCSFLELYNEELRDLFAADDLKKLRIFEQQLNNSYNNPVNKCTIMTQNLEEVVLQDAEHAMKLLQQGINKRQVASTRMNDVSSRSHTIFCINLFKQHRSEGNIREYRISKFNLVDLAGSENIGRSGALNQRAREAGSINQSLLTLGRVINGLVDGDQHIPYRESKLTRLLQDSLGGKTKTVLIANISPAKMNCEETLSTLQYASKAKNIKNKPQIGTLVNKTVLVKELGLELSKLKADLNATRLKNGIYIEESNYHKLQNEIENLKTEKKELQAENEMYKRQISSSRKQLQDANLSVSKKNYELENLHKVISNLYEKLDRQSENHQNLIENSSKFKTVVDLMNENISFLINKDMSLKGELQAIINEQVKEQREKLRVSLDRILSLNDTRFKDQVAEVKKRINQEFNELQSCTEEFSLKVANLFVSKLPDVCNQVKLELENLQSLSGSVHAGLQESMAVLTKSLESCKNIAHVDVNTINSTLEKEYKEQIEEELQIQESSLIEKMITLIQENTKKQRQELASRLINKNTELLETQAEYVLNSTTQLNLSAKTDLFKIHDTINSTLQTNNTTLSALSEKLSRAVDASSNTQLEVQTELIKLNSKSRLNSNESESLASYENLLDNMKIKVLQDYKTINDEANEASTANINIGKYLEGVNNDVLLDNQENHMNLSLPNDINTINKLIQDLDQQHQKINDTKTSPVRKSPRHQKESVGNDDSVLVFDAIIKNRQIYTPNRSPSKRVISALKKHSLNFQDVLIHDDDDDDQITFGIKSSRAPVQSPRPLPDIIRKSPSALPDSASKSPRALADITDKVLSSDDTRFDISKFSKPRSKSFVSPKLINNSKTVLSKNTPKHKPWDTSLSNENRHSLKRSRTVDSFSTTSSRAKNVGANTTNNRITKQRKLKSMLPLRKNLR